VRLFLDNCTSPALAATLNGFLTHRNGLAQHIADMPCGRDASDPEWIEMLRASGEEWIVLTGDGRLRKNPAERLAFRAARLKGFVLNPGYHKTPLNQVASFLLGRLPEIEQLARLTAAPFLYEIPMSRSARVRQLPL
jgi:hypothetical protein